VAGVSEVVSRFEALRSAVTPLVGRDEELDLLMRRWQQAKSGEGRVVLVSGEPGIGKSRLTAALSQRIETEPHTRLRYFCSPHHQDSALYPVIVQLERAAGFERDDGPEAKLDKLETLLGLTAEIGDLSPRRAVIAARRRSFRATRSEPAAQKGADLYGVGPAARRAGPNPTGADDF